jgi:hypothetical protein
VKYHFNARWYDADTARFVSEDPARDGVSWFAYVGNNPLVFTDPSGLYPKRIDPHLAQYQNQPENRDAQMSEVGAALFFPENLRTGRSASFIRNTLGNGGCLFIGVLNAANNERSRLNGVDFVRMGFEISENDEYFERIPVVTDTITAGVETTVYSSATIMTQQGIEQLWYDETGQEVIATRVSDRDILERMILDSYNGAYIIGRFPNQSGTGFHWPNIVGLPYYPDPNNTEKVFPTIDPYLYSNPDEVMRTYTEDRLSAAFIIETPAEKAQREAMWAFQDNITSQAIETGLVGGQGIIE